MFPQNVFPDSAEIDGQGRLVIGGCSALDLAEEYGTPVYVLDEATLRNRCRSYRAEFEQRCPHPGPGAQVLYASKAYINPALARIFNEEGLGLDVVSGGELAVAAAAQFPLEKVYFHGNNKTPDELAYSVEQGIGRVVVDSFHELELLNRIAGEAGKVQDILIRVSPGIDPHTHAYTTTGIIDSKFGFSIQTGDAERAIRQALAASQPGPEGLALPPGVAHLRAGTLCRRYRPGAALCRRFPRGGPGPAGVQPRRRLCHRLHPRPGTPDHRGIRRDHCLHPERDLRRTGAGHTHPTD